MDIKKVAIRYYAGPSKDNYDKYKHRVKYCRASKISLGISIDYKAINVRRLSNKTGIING